MYLRMLKKDLKDKVVLNIVLFIFMILAATLLVMSAGFVYTFIAGINTTYEKCNTSDIILIVDRSVSSAEEQQDTIIGLMQEYSEINEISVSERIIASTGRLDFEKIDKRTVSGLYQTDFLISPVSTDQNIPYDMHDEPITLDDGCVALSQVTASSSHTKIGDSIMITTDMGNIYRFVVSDIYKDPSSSMMTKILFSDRDYKTLCEEFTTQVDQYDIQLVNPFKTVSELQKWGWEINDRLRMMDENGEINGRIHTVTTGKSNAFTDEAMISLIVSIFMGLMGIALIILIFMAISFSLQATVKREEKEIGTMRAIGVDSLSYKSLFVVKYIAFAVLGGVIGLIAGIPLEKYMVSRFVTNTLNPDKNVIILLGVITCIIFMLLMLVFSFVSLRRIDRISVMDAIHGEGKGERFSKIPGVSLSKRKNTSVPLFLALQDIIRKMKRYIFLVISYMIGMTILFLQFQIKATVVSDEYRKTYWSRADRDFMIRPEDGLRDKLLEMTGSYKNLYLYYEQLYNEHGIPVDIQLMDEQTSFVIMNGEKSGAAIAFGDVDLSRMTYVKGGKVPSLPNEVAASHFLALTNGTELGDVVTLEYKVYGEDGFTVETRQKDYIITAFVETMGNSRTPIFFLAQADDNMYCEDFDLFNESIDAPRSEHAYYIEKMREVDERILVWDYDQALDYDLGNSFGKLLDLLALVTGTIMAITLFAMTFLYQQIFIEEETSDIAMLKSMGFDKWAVRKWHYYRLLIMIVLSTALALLSAFTLNKWLFNRIGSAVLGLVSFKIASPPVSVLILLPAVLVMIISAVMAVSFRSMDQIRIWRIRNE
ncbi:MAG: ABC transporter permease [Lachnospiraceae bacterium]|nr:ABC transporter permease [Lachnospiraceae bacterium]